MGKHRPVSDRIAETQAQLSALMAKAAKDQINDSPEIQEIDAEIKALKTAKGAEFHAAQAALEQRAKGLTVAGQQFLLDAGFYDDVHDGLFALSCGGCAGEGAPVIRATCEPGRPRETLRNLQLLERAYELKAEGFTITEAAKTIQRELAESLSPTVLSWRTIRNIVSKTNNQT